MTATLKHFAINAGDVGRARRFYESVFGWKFSAWGPPGFFEIQTGGAVDGALQERRELVPGKATIGFECTIGVEDVDAIARRVVESGGRVILEKTVIAGVGELIFFEDTEGNVAGAMRYDANAG